MSRAGDKRRPWREQQIRLSNATVTSFTGPGDDVTIVVHGSRTGAVRTTRQTDRGARARSTTKGRQ